MILTVMDYELKFKIATLNLLSVGHEIIKHASIYILYKFVQTFT